MMEIITEESAKKFVNGVLDSLPRRDDYDAAEYLGAHIADLLITLHKYIRTHTGDNITADRWLKTICSAVNACIKLDQSKKGE